MRDFVSKFFLYTAVVLVILVTAFPFIWALSSSFRSGADLFSANIFPAAWRWQNYAEVFSQQPFGRNILNSVAIASGTVVASVTIGVLAAYALGRLQFRGRMTLMLTVLSVSMFPQVAILSGLFELLQFLGLTNSWTGLIFSYFTFTMPFTIWILTSFIREIPKSIEEAAILDGAKPLTLIFKVFLPLLQPAVVTTGLLAFILAWNEFLFALTFTLTDKARTVPVAIAYISGASQFELPWGNIMAASVIVTIPLVALVLLFQRKIVAGLTAGAVKG